MLGRIFRHIKLNALPLFFILTFTSLFILVFRGDLQRQMQEKDEAKQLVIGFFKKDKLEQEYFGTLKTRLQNVFGAHTDRYDLKFIYYPNIKAMINDLKTGALHIAGELSPIDYAEYRQRYDFSSFLGINYVTLVKQQPGQPRDDAK